MPLNRVLNHWVRVFFGLILHIVLLGAWESGSDFVWDSKFFYLSVSSVLCEHFVLLWTATVCVGAVFISRFKVCFSVCVCVWERCAQSNYVFRTEPSGHLCGRPPQSARDRLVDISSPRLVCVCVWTGNHHFVSSGSLLSFDATKLDKLWWDDRKLEVGEESRLLWTNVAD